MIVQIEYIPYLDWTVYILHKISCSNNNTVVDYLQSIDCPSYLINEALSNLDTCKPNIGLTYSNPSERKSVVAISKSTSKGEYVNTITHELYHLLSQLSKYAVLTEEDAATLCGNLNMKVYEFIKS